MYKLILKILIVIALVLPKCIAANQNTYGPTSKADQLWQIAVFVRPNASVSIQQTMLAILRDNPQSFIDANVNRIKQGSVLKIPTLEEIQQIAPNVATQQIDLQNTAWRKLSKNKITSPQLVKLQTQFDSTGKALLNFDQQYQTRLADLNQQNMALQNQIQQLQQRVNELHNNIIQLKKLPQFSLLLNKYIKNIRFAKVEYLPLIFFAIATLLFIIWLILYRRKKMIQQIIISDDTKSEYDFMSSKEGIQAKIDLAHAYIDMGDKENARRVLNEIIAKGKISQRSEAKKLLKQIK
ncbi:MAG: hypothetical protein AMJ43_01220 [Coxiella sp. DG_40]|nr:MAG: hypothetical protein AMJ43_01220 [Coxiella sp. DG_40]